MKKTRRLFTLLLALLLLSLCACGKSGQVLSGDTGTSEPAEEEFPADTDPKDSLFPDRHNFSVFKLDSFEDYKILRNGAAQGGDALDEALALARKKYDNSSLMTTTDQVKKLVEEIGNVKIVVPGNSDWKCTSVRRVFFCSVSDLDPTVIIEKSLRVVLIYENPEVGTIACHVFYNRKPARSAREFYHNRLDGVEKYISPEPYFTIPLATGETFVYYVPAEAIGESNFILTDGSEIFLNFDYGDTEAGARKKPTEEKVAIAESVSRSFLDGARVMALNEAAG